MDKKELIQLIEKGSDIMFDCLGKHFTILTWTDDGIYIAEQDTEKNEQTFSTATELVDNYIIKGKPLRECLDSLKITDYS